MSSLKITDVLRPFDGEGDIIEWLNKIELVAKLRDLKDLHNVIPLFLEGSAFAVYNELDEDKKKEADAIKSALVEAFGMNSFQAYERFIKRVWNDESVDVYLTDLRKLGRLAGVLSDKLLLKAFVVGLPGIVSRELRAMSKIESLPLSQVVERARTLMAELVERPPVVAAMRQEKANSDAKSKSAKPATVVDGEKVETEGRVPSGRDSRRCFRCGGAHLIKFCKSKAKISCWTCGEEGHTSKFHYQGNEAGRAGAPAVLPRSE